MGWRALVHEARQRLAAEGFDLLEACSRLRLADLEEEGLRLAPDGFRPDALTLVVGNGRALWPVVRDRVSRGELAPDADPVDRHSEATMERLGQDLRASFGAPRIALHFAHRRDAEGSYLPFQRIAAATGFAELGATVNEVDRSLFKAVVEPHLVGDDVPWSQEQFDRLQAIK